MTRDRWERLKAILSDALPLPASEREAFVRRAADGDTELVAELIRLIEENDRETDLLSNPVLPRAGSAPEMNDGPRFPPGIIVGRRFRILRFIARGGMGEVYEAEDLELGGHVALKSIRRRIAADPELLALFKREIQLARRVTHPNVCRMFDIVHDEESDSILLSMELIEGKTLHERLRHDGPMHFRDALPLIEEIAAGLQAVHDAGVIHGDLKPGNVMLTSRPGDSRQHAIVMDFGLASPMAHSAEKGPAIRGRTPDYSAPEQASGEPITTATDVYCLALVIADMLGVPRSDRLAPAAERMPLGWARVLRRCLAAEPERRFARPADFSAALRATAGWWRNTIVASAIILLVATAILLLGEFYFRDPNRDQHGPTGRFLFEESDSVTARCPSPDGRVLAMTSWDTGDLVLRDVATGKIRRLTQNLGKQDGGYRAANAAVFSPDGRRIAYLWMSSRTTGELHLTGADGRGDRILYQSPGTIPIPLDWSPEGAQILVRLWRLDQTQQLAVISVADGSLRMPNTPDAAARGKAIFGGDGESVLYEQLKANETIRGVSLAGMESALVLGPGRNSLIGWTRDRKYLVFGSDRRGIKGIWAAAILEQRVTGEPRELIPQTEFWEPLGVTTSGSLFYRQNADFTDVITAVLDLDSGRTISEPRRVADSFTGSHGYPSWSPDGRLAFTSWQPGSRPTLVLYDLRTGSKRVLSVGLSGLGRLQWFSNGTAIVASGNKDGVRGLYRIEASTGDATLLLSQQELETSLEGVWSADGRIHFNRYLDPRRGIFRLNTRTRERRTLYVPPAGIDVATENLALSPDGRTLAFHARNDAEKTSTLMLIPEQGGEARPLLTVHQPEAFIFGAFTWTPDSRAILASRTRDNRVSELWRIPVDGGTPQKIEFPAQRVTWLRLSADGKTIAFEKESWRSEIWVREKFIDGER